MDTNKFNVYNFQEPATPVAEGIIDLHNYIVFYLIIVLVFVVAILFDIVIQNFEVFKIKSFTLKGLTNYITFQPRNAWSFRKIMLQLNKVNHATNLEIAWTVLPSFILVFIAVPSLSLLYSMDEMLYPELTFKAIGYQWYWSYEVYGMCEMAALDMQCASMEIYEYLEGMKSVSFDSYMQSIDWSNFGHRLLEVDRDLALPVEEHIRVLVTGADVLHSWAVPSFGIKIDAIPGRLNQGAIYIKREGIFYGQCSELCGVNHGFMPIVVHAMDVEEFEDWGMLELEIFAQEKFDRIVAAHRKAIK